uniref:Uncharacterized protein n=1 Tax=Tetranychus urticae TaxID=32264 RepID=T1KAZ8_TETUR
MQQVRKCNHLNHHFKHHLDQHQQNEANSVSPSFHLFLGLT